MKKNNCCHILGVWKINSALGQGGRADQKPTEANEKDPIGFTGF